MLSPDTAALLGWIAAGALVALGLGAAAVVVISTHHRRHHTAPAPTPDDLDLRAAKTHGGGRHLPPRDAA